MRRRNTVRDGRRAGGLHGPDDDMRGTRAGLAGLIWLLVMGGVITQAAYDLTKGECLFKAPRLLEDAAKTFTHAPACHKCSSGPTTHNQSRSTARGVTAHSCLYEVVRCVCLRPDLPKAHSQDNVCSRTRVHVCNKPASLQE